MVANPVDVLASVFLRHSGLPAERVIGTGTMLDTARLRQVLGAELGLNPVSVHAQVVGEHGDSEVPLWSSAQAGGMALRDWPGWSREREANIATEVRRAAYEIIRRKGATNHAIGLVTANLLQAVLRDEQRILTVSREHADLAAATGVADTPRVALSLPCVVGSAGATRTIMPQMDEAERAALLHSAQVLATALSNADH